MKEKEEKEKHQGLERTYKLQQKCVSIVRKLLFASMRESAVNWKASCLEQMEEELEKGKEINEQG